MELPVTNEETDKYGTLLGRVEKRGMRDLTRHKRKVLREVEARHSRGKSGQNGQLRERKTGTMRGKRKYEVQTLFAGS